MATESLDGKSAAANIAIIGVGVALGFVAGSLLMTYAVPKLLNR